MTPSIDERLASVVRALTEVILPHLPADASLAQEQAQLAIGHIQIIRAQLDAAPGYEREELDDAVAIGRALGAGVTGGDLTGRALGKLSETVSVADGSDVRGQRQAIHDAVEGLVKAVSADGDAAARTALPRIVLEHERKRARKDRKWFAPFGFDSL